MKTVSKQLNAEGFQCERNFPPLEVRGRACVKIINDFAIDILVTMQMYYFILLIHIK